MNQTATPRSSFTSLSQHMKSSCMIPLVMKKKKPPRRRKLEVEGAREGVHGLRKGSKTNLWTFWIQEL